MELWCEWIVNGAACAEVVVVRAYGEFERANIVHVDDLEVRPSDLAPVWALQQMMLHSDPPTMVSFAEWARSLPLEHNVVRQSQMDLLNRAGLHTAHFVDVAPQRRTKLLHADVLRHACLVELHPANVFWLPKARWQYWGADTRVKAHFAELMKRHVPRAWKDLMERAAVDDLPSADPDFEYFYSEQDWFRRTHNFRLLRSETTIRTPQVRQIVFLLNRSTLTQFSDAQVREILEQGKADGEFRTKQDVMLVFNYYRKRLKGDGVLSG